MTTINCGNCKGTHESAAQVKTCFGNSGRFNDTVDLPETGANGLPTGNGRIMDPTVEHSRAAEKAEFAERERQQEEAAYRAKMERDRNLAGPAMCRFHPDTEAELCDRGACDERHDDELVRQAQQAQRKAAMATDKQMGFINRLREERGMVPAATGDFTKREASAEIDRLKAIKVDRVSTTPKNEVPQGIHFYDGSYWKVQEARTTTGRLYAKQWNGEGWDYRPGGLRNLSEDTKVTAEQAAEFGRLYGVCCFCTRDLTDERSIAVGYGPVCAENHGLPWGHVAEGQDAAV